MIFTKNIAIRYHMETPVGASRFEFSQIIISLLLEGKPIEAL